MQIKQKPTSAHPIRCPQCGIKNSERTKYCRTCGARLLQICPHCHTENTMGCRFCGECGKLLNRLAESDTKGHSTLEPSHLDYASFCHNFITSPKTVPSKQKCCLFLTSLYFILLLYFTLLIFFPHHCFPPVPSISDGFLADLLVLGFCFVSSALFMSRFIDFSFRKLVAAKIYRAKLGQVLVYEGYITKDQLAYALREQKFKLGEMLLHEGLLTEKQLRLSLRQQRFKIGDVLVRAGKVTQKQLRHALEYQKKAPSKIGEIFKALGYATDKDIQWALQRRGRRLGEILIESDYLGTDEIQYALNQMHRQLGEILLQNGFITEYEFHAALIFQRYGKRKLQLC